MYFLSIRSLDQIRHQHHYCVNLWYFSFDLSLRIGPFLVLGLRILMARHYKAHKKSYISFFQSAVANEVINASCAKISLGIIEKMFPEL